MRLTIGGIRACKSLKITTLAFLSRAQLVSLMDSTLQTHAHSLRNLFVTYILRIFGF